MENTAKLEAIKKAYGEYYESVKDKIVYNDYTGWGDGWLYYQHFSQNTQLYHKIKEDLGAENHPLNLGFRPVSLKGLESNNGWISILSEADLPKESGKYWVLKENYSYPIIENKHPDDNEYWMVFTHYQKIIIPELPIY